MPRLRLRAEPSRHAQKRRKGPRNFRGPFLLCLKAFVATGDVYGKVALVATEDGHGRVALVATGDGRGRVALVATGDGRGRVAVLCDRRWTREGRSPLRPKMDAGGSQSSATKDVSGWVAIVATAGTAPRSQQVRPSHETPTNYQLPTTNYHLPTTTYPLPTTHKMQSKIVNRKIVNMNCVPPVQGFSMKRGLAS